jgi:hypothetical protein
VPHRSVIQGLAAALAGLARAMRHPGVAHGGMIGGRPG